MNSPIFTKYWTALLDLGIASEVDSAFALALHLAIAEAAKSAIPESALVAAQNDAAMLRQQLANERFEIDALRTQLLLEIDALRTQLLLEIDALRTQLLRLDADNADLTRKLATANGNGAPEKMQP